MAADSNELAIAWMNATDGRAACNAAAQRRIDALLAEARIAAERTGRALSGDLADAHGDLDTLEALVRAHEGSGLPSTLRDPIRVWAIELALRALGGWWAPAPPRELDPFFPEPVRGLGAAALSEPMSPLAGPWLPRVGIVRADRPRLRDWWSIAVRERTPADEVAVAAWRSRRDAVPLSELADAGYVVPGAPVRLAADVDHGIVIGPTGLLERGGRSWDDPTHAMVELAIATPDRTEGWTALRVQVKQGGWIDFRTLQAWVLHKRDDFEPVPSARARYESAPRSQVVAADVAGAENALVLLAMEPNGCIYGARLAEHLRTIGFRVREAMGEAEITAGRWSGEVPSVIAACRVVSSAIGRVRIAERQNGQRPVPVVLTGGVPPAVMLPAARASSASAVCMVGGPVDEALLRVGWPHAFAAMCAARGIPEEAQRWPEGAAHVGQAH